MQAWRNLSYLEGELDSINALEEERIAENDRQMQQMQRTHPQAPPPSSTGWTRTRLFAGWYGASMRRLHQTCMLS